MPFNTYYQDELNYLRELGREFAAAYPEAAQYLTEAGSDPDVERLLEGTAFLTGRLRQKLDDELPEFTHALIETFWPHYLRPTPAFTTLQFEASRPNDKEIRRIPARSAVDSVPVDGTTCRFHTIYDVEVPPLQVTNLVLRSTHPASIRVTLKANEGVRWSTLGLKHLRFHCAGAPAQANALLYCLTRSCIGVTLCCGEQRIPLPQGAWRGMGFEAGESLYPGSNTTFPGFVLLHEYFAYPAKFSYVEVGGLAALAGFPPGEEVVIEFTLSEVPAGMAQVAQGNLLLGCTPAVNLFTHEAVPISIDSARSEYKVIPAGDDPGHFDIWSIDAIAGIIPGEGKPKPFRPLHQDGMAHAPPGGTYLVRRKPAVVGTGNDCYLSIAASFPGVETLSLDVTCTNGRLPQALGPGDITTPTQTCPPGVRFRNLTKPTASLSMPLGGSLEWRLLGHLTLNYRSLADVGALRSLLDLYNIRAWFDQAARQAHRRLLDAIRAVTAEPATQVADGALLRGIAITVDVDPTGFDGEGDLVLFGNLLDAFFAQYVSLNAFSRLTIRGIGGGEDRRWPARLGRRRLI